MIDLQITIDELKKIKEDIFNKNVSEEEKNNIINDINNEIEKILEDFIEKEDIEIDE